MFRKKKNITYWCTYASGSGKYVGWRSETNPKEWCISEWLRNISDDLEKKVSKDCYITDIKILEEEKR